MATHYTIMLRNQNLEMSFTRTFYDLTKDEAINRAKATLKAAGEGWRVTVYEETSSCVYMKNGEVS
jgi:hypothetical protein